MATKLKLTGKMKTIPFNSDAQLQQAAELLRRASFDLGPNLGGWSPTDLLLDNMNISLERARDILKALGVDYKMNYAKKNPRYRVRTYGGTQRIIKTNKRGQFDEYPYDIRKVKNKTKLSQSEMLKNPSSHWDNAAETMAESILVPGKSAAIVSEISLRINRSDAEGALSVAHQALKKLYSDSLMGLRDKAAEIAVEIVRQEFTTAKPFYFSKRAQKLRGLRENLSFPMKENPTLRARKPYSRKPHSRTHFDTGPKQGKYVYVQEQRGAMWVTLAAAKDSAKGRTDAQRWAQVYHRKHSGSKLRIFV